MKMTDKNETPKELPAIQRDPESGFGRAPDYADFIMVTDAIMPGAVINGQEVAIVTLMADNPQLASKWVLGDHATVVSWQPAPPPGDGWRLVIISDEPEGPAAMFVRPGHHGIIDGKKYAQEFLLGSLINAATKHLKTLSKPWIDCKEKDQQRILAQIKVDCTEALRDAIDIISSNGRLTIAAHVDQVVFKDGVKAVLSLAKGPWAHALADAEGGYCTVVLEDRSPLLQEGDSMKVDPDQKSLVD